MIVTIGTGGVGQCNAIAKQLERLGSLSRVTINATHQVMGPHAVGDGAVVLEIGKGIGHERVVGQRLEAQLRCCTLSMTARMRTVLRPQEERQNTAMTQRMTNRDKCFLMHKR